MRTTSIFAGIHLAGNALLLWLGYYWLGLGESRTGALLWSALVALVLLALACWLHGASFPFFAERRVADAFRTALRRLGPLVAAAVGILIVYALLSSLADWTSKPAFTIASWLTLKLRKPVKPESVGCVFLTVMWLLRWMVVPVLLLPMIAAIASRGWSGFKSIAERRKWLFWIETPVLLVLAVWVPLKLLGWVPHLSSFGGEMTSFVIRALLAYLLFVAGWLALAFVTSAGAGKAR